MRDSTFRCAMLLLVIALTGSAILPLVRKTKAMTDSSTPKLSLDIDETKLATQVTTPTNQNPLIAKWEGPYGGVPPFDKVQVSLFKPALEAAMSEQLAEIDPIAADTAAPTFANTIEALERSGNSLNRVSTLYAVWSSTMNNSEFQTVEREMAPKLAAFNDKITANEPLFKRIETVYNSPEKARLTPRNLSIAAV